MRRHALLVGVFVLVALVLGAVGVMTLSGSNLFSKRLKAVVYFERSVRGLYVGAPVTFRGVKIGEVNDIGIEVDPKTLATRIPVRLTLGTDTLRMSGPGAKRVSDLPDLVRRGLRAKLMLQSVVTGQAAIDLDFRPDTPLRLMAGGRSAVPEIPTMRDRLDALIEQVSDLPLRDTVSDLRRTMNTLEETLKVTQRAVEGSSQQLNAVAAQAKDTLQVSSRALQDVQRQAHATLASIQQLSDSSRAVVLQTQPELQRTLQSTQQAAQAAQQAMSNLAEISAPDSALRSDVEFAVRDLSLAARSLRSFSDQLERRPNALLFGKKAP